MNSSKPAFSTIEDYISSFPPPTRNLLKELRKAINSAAPDAEERISYQMPSFSQNGILVYFAAFKNHIGFYPTATGVYAFRKELSVYKGGKGSIQFPIDKPLPLALVRRIVKFKVLENRAKSRKK
jgi:uncharacterized protein YdhG (YjbR/CyaY superfamily)